MKIYRVELDLFLAAQSEKAATRELETLLGSIGGVFNIHKFEEVKDNRSITNNNINFKTLRRQPKPSQRRIP